MGRKARVSKGKNMKPNFFVFCEGETEVAYVKYLRTLFRVPIQVIPKKSDSNISTKYIENCKREYVSTKNDRTFLMFDLDVPGILGRLQKLPNAILLVSNPCIELWFLLHYEDCKTELSSAECVQRLRRLSLSYTKGILAMEERQVLALRLDEAFSRAVKLKAYDNPSTTVWRLIEELNT